ncbi:MAG: hypothetical protein AAF849_19935 [Bacteroidota bacterium]
MIKFAVRTIAFLVVAILIYNFFFGTSEEKETTQKIVREFKDVGVAVKDLLQAEKEKLDEGKYDNALDKIGGLFQKVKNSVEKIDPDALSKLNRLERKRKELSEELHENDQDQMTDQEKEHMNEEMKRLLRETERLLNEINEEQEVN